LGAKMRHRKWFIALAAATAMAGVGAGPLHAQNTVLEAKVAAAAKSLQPKVVTWRRDIHEHPELSNREVRTGKLVAAHLKALGMEVRTGIAHTGVIGILRGGKPGGVVALRADMDALPIKEKTGLSFASQIVTEEAGEKVPVMHSCGHDAHVAILMGAAELLAGMKAEIPGTVVFIFQPAEEWTPPGEEAGAKLVMKEGALDGLNIGAIFATHVWPEDAGVASLRPGGFFANEDNFKLVLKGKQAHGAKPWHGIDTVTVAAQIINGLNTIVSRSTDLTKAPAVVTTATVHGGQRSNIIPEEITLTGTIRTLDNDMRDDILKRVRKIVETTAAAYGATTDLEISADYPLTYNDPALMAKMLPTIQRSVGADKLDANVAVSMGAEDFSFYLGKIPGLYWLLGAGDTKVPRSERAENHSPYYDIVESALEVGVRTQAQLALDYLASTTPSSKTN
jgi:amidohydrolase